MNALSRIIDTIRVSLGGQPDCQDLPLSMMNRLITLPQKDLPDYLLRYIEKNNHIWNLRAESICAMILHSKIQFEDAEYSPVFRTVKDNPYGLPPKTEMVVEFRKLRDYGIPMYHAIIYRNEESKS